MASYATFPLQTRQGLLMGELVKLTTERITFRLDKGTLGEGDEAEWRVELEGYGKAISGKLTVASAKVDGTGTQEVLEGTLSELSREHALLLHYWSIGSEYPAEALERLKGTPAHPPPRRPPPDEDDEDSEDEDTDEGMETADAGRVEERRKALEEQRAEAEARRERMRANFVPRKKKTIAQLRKINEIRSEASIKPEPTPDEFDDDLASWLREQKTKLKDLEIPDPTVELSEGRLVVGYRGLSLYDLAYQQYIRHRGLMVDCEGSASGELDVEITPAGGEPVECGGKVMSHAGGKLIVELSIDDVALSALQPARSLPEPADDDDVDEDTDAGDEDTDAGDEDTDDDISVEVDIEPEE